MLKNVCFVLFTSFIISCASQKPRCTQVSENPPTHEKYDALLKKHVTDAGLVNYKGLIQDSLELNSYLTILENNHPTKKWTKNERLAYWINAYNAFTLRLVTRNYPFESIKELGGSIYQVNTTWDINFIEICEVSYNLNNLEHQKIRKQFNEPRIHFAVNCASTSCPKLLNEAFTSEGLNEQLDRVTSEFINDKSRNNITSSEAKLSKIFKWYSGDFKSDSLDVIGFINQYSEAKISDDADVSYLDYYWSLNEQRSN